MYARKNTYDLTVDTQPFLNKNVLANRRTRDKQSKSIWLFFIMILGLQHACISTNACESEISIEVQIRAVTC